MTFDARLNRRQLIRVGGASLVGATAIPFAAQLASMGSAAAATGPGDYKALVCMFWYGGNDAHNTVLATDADTWGRYFAARNTGQDPIALMPVGTAPTAIGSVSSVTGRTAGRYTPEAWGGVVPFTPKTKQAVPAGTNASARTFAVHPFLNPILPLFSAGRLAVVANVGTLTNPITKAQYTAKSAAYPLNLFSHNDQQSEWQAGAAEGAQLGWGGQMADALKSLNTTNPIFTAISTSGNAVFLSGQQVVQYQVTNNAMPAVAIGGLTSASIDGSSTAAASLKAIINDSAPASSFVGDYVTVMQRSLGATDALNASVTSAPVTSIPAVPTYTNPLTGTTETNPLAVQLNTVARIIAAAPALGVKRQVFFVSMNGFDTHNLQNTAQPNNLAKIAQAMTYFDTAMSSVGGLDYRPNVTMFTASDFSRTFTTNGEGTDHAWGSHHFVLGGAVNGGDMYGQYPTLGIDTATFKNPDMVGSAVVPSTSVDQYAATLGRWFGVPDATLNAIFPNLKNYATPYLGVI